MTKKVQFNHGKFFSEFSALETGSNRSKVQILRTGSWSHPQYGDFSITEADLDEFVFNFQANVIGHDICVDENHDWEHKALGWYKELVREGSGLFAIIEWNEKGLEKVNSGEYKYFSPELYFSYKPSDSSQVFRNVLVGGGITNRPFFKKMQALKMSESFSESEEKSSFYFFDSQLMNRFKTLLAEFSVKDKLSKLEVDSLTSAFNEIPEADRTPEDIASYEAQESKLSEADHDAPEGKEGEGDGAGEGEGEGEGDGAGAGDGAGDEKPEGKIEASEKDSALLAKFSEDEKAALIFAMTGMTPTEIKEVQSTASKLQKEKTFSDIKTRLTAFCYSESNKSGFLNPTQVEKVAQFEEKLPEALRGEFEKLFSDRTFVDPSIFSEIGSREVPSEFSVPSDTPEGVTRESYVQSHIANKLFSEGKAKTQSEALSQAKKIIAEKNIQ